MKSLQDMSLGELAAYINTILNQAEIEVILSGGACVSIYTENKYESYDLDFIERKDSQRKKIKAILQKIGFHEKNRYFINSKIDYYIEFPAGPLAIGSEPVKNINIINYETGSLKLLTPTDCIKDRLAAYYFWNDLQALQQALMVSSENEFDIKEIERWSKAEGMFEKFNEIKNKIKK